MFGIVTKVVITQRPNDRFSDRKKQFTFNFVNDFRASSTWAHLTDTGTLILPRAIYFVDENGTKTTWDKTQVYGNLTGPPLMMRGDKIVVEIGYSYFKPTGGANFDRNTVSTKMAERFEGFITKIKNKTPIELECEDNMYLCKQTIVKDATWNIDGNPLTLEKMLKQMCADSTISEVRNFTIKTDNYQHKIQKFYTKHYTLAMVLDDLRKHFHFESFFRGNELRCGVIRYYPEERQTHTFQFGYKNTGNIINDSLEYTRADDVRIGIIAKSINKIELQTVNSSGKKKTSHKQIEVRVGDQDGELKTLFFMGITDTAELKKQAEAKLPFLKYEGFRGSFLTFGLPAVKHGDMVELVNYKIPEQNGTYLVKEVQPSCSSGGGLRQRIFLDIRIDGLTPDQVDTFTKNGL